MKELSVSSSKWFTSKSLNGPLVPPDTSPSLPPPPSTQWDSLTGSPALTRRPLDARDKNVEIAFLLIISEFTLSSKIPFPKEH